MASIIGGFVRGLISLLTKVQFWIAVIILMVIVILSGQIAILTAYAASAPELADMIMRYTLLGLFFIAIVVVALIACKYLR